jgi:hypothetical protein
MAPTPKSWLQALTQGELAVIYRDARLLDLVGSARFIHAQNLLQLELRRSVASTPSRALALAPTLPPAPPPQRQKPGAAPAPSGLRWHRLHSFRFKLWLRPLTHAGGRYGRGPQWTFGGQAPSQLTVSHKVVAAT